MESISFQTIWGGVIVVPGMLVYVDKKRQQMAQLKELIVTSKGKVTALAVVLPDGQELHVPLKEVFGAVHYDPRPLPETAPEEYRSLTVLTLPFRMWLEENTGKTVTYRLGDQVVFTDEEEVRALTGHQAPKCIGSIQMMNEAGMLYVGFVANPDATSTRWFLKCWPDEVWVVTNREPLGKYGVRLAVTSVYGEAVERIVLDEPPSHPRSE